MPDAPVREAGRLLTSVLVTVRNAKAPARWQFVNDVRRSCKAGCNSTACHGSPAAERLQAVLFAMSAADQSPSPKTARARVLPKDQRTASSLLEPTLSDPMRAAALKLNSREYRTILVAQGQRAAGSARRCGRVSR